MNRHGYMRVVLLVTAVAISLVPQSASAQPGPASSAAGEPSRLGLPAGFASWAQLFDAQRPLDEAATRVEDAASAHPGSGFTSVTVDAAKGTLTVFWHGTPSKAEQAVLDHVRHQGTTVTLVPARYSKLDLDRQVAQIALDATAGGAERVTHITKRPDGSGIEVGVAPAQAPSARTGAPLGSSLAHVQAAGRDVELTITIGSNDRAPGLSRESDTPAYWGGALVRYSADSYCSSGFAVHWPQDGNDYMTTAAHCGGVWQTYSNGNFTSTMGPGTPGGTGYDLMFIRTASGTAGRIYTGPRAYAAGQGSMPVTRASHTHVGDSLCTGGAATGWHCYIRASGPTQDCRAWVAAVGLGNCFNVEGGITTVANQLIAGHGDSGGPVWTPINGFDQPNSSADARGLISSRPDGWADIPCGNDPVFNQPNTCSTAVWFTDVVSAIGPWAASGMYVKTS
ncbi:hypothetical protein [Longispora fulva]|nr:hypothetical protein [Longispora fulva]